MARQAGQPIVWPERASDATDPGRRRLELRDQRLIEALQRTAAGDRAAFRQVYELTAPRLNSLVLRTLRDRALAEDALQDAYLKIWRNAYRYDPDVASPWAWLTVLVRRVALDKRPRVFADIPLECLVAPSCDFDQIHPRTAECLKALPKAQGAALILTYVYGYSHSEVAEIMDAPVGTVKSWVRRAVVNLRKALEEGPALDPAADNLTAA